MENGVQLGQHGLEPEWRVCNCCKIGKLLGDGDGVSLAHGVGNEGAPARPRLLTLSAVMTIRQIVLHCLLPGSRRGLEVAGDLFEVVENVPGLPGFGSMTERLIAFYGALQFAAGFVILFEFE